MDVTLEKVKDQLSDKYLGKEGIHAIGIRRGRNAVTVYFSPQEGLARQSLLESMKKEAFPFDVLSVPEGSPRLL